MPASVLIVDDRRDVLELSRILLLAEGYETEGCSYAEATPERLRQNAPQVVLLDLVPGDEAPWALLRRLRQDDATSEVGVVVTSDSPALVERAVRDRKLGVTTGLVMPFDIEALYAAITAAMRHESKAIPDRTAMPLLQRAADTLRQDRRRVLLRFAQCLSTLNAFQRRPDLSLADLQGHSQALLDGVAEALALQANSHNALAATAGVDAEAAHAHARLRRSQGFRAADIAREMATLRSQVWQALQELMARAGPSLDELWSLHRRLDLAIDETLFAMLETVDEDRDTRL